MDYVLHFAIGMSGAGAGYYASSFCSHETHVALRWCIAVGLVLLETVVTVNLVG